MFFGEMLLQNTLLFLAEKLLLYKFFCYCHCVVSRLSDCIYLHAVWVENCTDQIKEKISMRQVEACLA